MSPHILADRFFGCLLDGHVVPGRSEHARVIGVALDRHVDKGITASFFSTPSSLSVAKALRIIVNTGLDGGRQVIGRYFVYLDAVVPLSTTGKSRMGRICSRHFGGGEIPIITPVRMSVLSLRMATAPPTSLKQPIFLP